MIVELLNFLVMKKRATEFISRFVVDGREKKIGESIALDKDILIVKSGKIFLGIPIKHVEDIGDALKVRGLVDLDRAVDLGNKWYAKYGKRG